MIDNTVPEAAKLSDAQALALLLGENWANEPQYHKSSLALWRPSLDAASAQGWHSRDAEVAAAHEETNVWLVNLANAAIENQIAQVEAKYAALVAAGKQLWGFINGEEGAIVDSSWPKALTDLEEADAGN